MFGKALFTLAAQAAGTLGTIAIGIVLARTLGPAGRGVVTYAWLVFGLAAIYADGPAAAIMAQYATERFKRGSVYRAMLRALPVLLIPAMIGFVAVGILVKNQGALVAVAVALPVGVYAQCVKGFFLAEGRIRTANAVDLIPIVGYAVLGSVVVLLGGGIAGALATWVFANAASAVYAALALGRYPALERSTVSGDAGALARRQLIFGGKSGFVYAAGYVNLRMGSFVVAALLGPSALGIYSVVVAICELLWKISNALAWSAFGRIAGDDDVRELMGRLTRSVMLVQVFLAAGLFVVGPWLVTALYGPLFAGAALPLRIMVFGVAAYALEPILGYFLVVRCKRPMLILAIQVGAAALSGALTILVLPHFGIAGAAAVTASIYVVVVAVKAVIVARILEIPITDLLVPRISDATAVVGVLRSALRRRFAATAAAA